MAFCWRADVGSFICLLGTDWRISLQLNETNTDISFNSSSDELTNDLPRVSSIDITLPTGVCSYVQKHVIDALDSFAENLEKPSRASITCFWT